MARIPFNITKQVFRQVYYMYVMALNLNYAWKFKFPREVFKNTFMADRGQLNINNTQNQTPALAHFFVRKELGTDTVWFIIREAKLLSESFYLLITLRNSCG